MKFHEKWFDKNGMINTKPVGERDTDQVNDTLFTVTFRLLKQFLNLGDITNDNIQKLYDSYLYSRDSHDNKTGLVAVLEYHRGDLILNEPVNELAHGRKWYHPRDWIFYGAHKYLLIEWCFMWIIDIAAIVSCATTWKKNKNGKHLTTSGKLLALTRMIAFERFIALNICTWLIKRNEHFGSWYNVAKIYFPYEDHPTVILCKLLDDRL